MYKIIIQVFCIILRLGVPWVCRLEHTLVWFLILLAFLWVYQLGHRPSWRPSDHQELTNGEPFLSSCFYCSFSLPFFFLVIPSWNSDNIFLLGDAVQTDAVFIVRDCLGRQTDAIQYYHQRRIACCGGFLHYIAAVPLYQYHSLFYSKLLDLFLIYLLYYQYLLRQLIELFFAFLYHLVNYMRK